MNANERQRLPLSAKLGNTANAYFTFGSELLKFSEYERRNHKETGNARTVIGHIIGAG
ncbi:MULTISPECIES: hypothetical protein [unclassified Chryseobacterium]|uniref:hypothetical protein n=1 Tax=unclassified Chryseobacterium TaxID=2593645 RepID=UPI00195A53D4|nr:MULTISPECIES: hypothetical protein [unclassified Chryseobacterium]MDH6211314.1 hypothetical protein [Chryseobacterium sp. BIGb0186]